MLSDTVVHYLRYLELQLRLFMNAKTSTHTCITYIMNIFTHMCNSTWNLEILLCILAVREHLKSNVLTSPA